MPFTETAEKEAIDVSYEFDYTRERRQTAYKQLPFLWGPERALHHRKVQHPASEAFSASYMSAVPLLFPDGA